jgi:hypothetical protein
MAGKQITMEVVVVKNRIPLIASMIPTIMREETDNTAHAIIDDAEKAMHEAKTGKWWYVKNPNTGSYFWHQASAPGEAPAILSSDLLASSEVGDVPMGHIATWDTPYASVLEFGKGRVAPRPFARPAATQNFPKFVNKVANRIRSV